jgi:hypothetical protein
MLRLVSTTATAHRDCHSGQPGVSERSEQSIEMQGADAQVVFSRLRIAFGTGLR